MKICPTFDEEKKLWNKGYQYVVGIDEVGRGCFAGPLVIGAVIFPKSFCEVREIKDSKLLSPPVRLRVADYIRSNALDCAVAEVSVKEINVYGVGKATHIGYRKVLKKLQVMPDFILIDAFYIRHKSRKKQKAIVKGDAICVSIAAASIIAKVYRDNLMTKLSKQYSIYNFAQNKGYGTRQHQKAIKSYGLSDLHRSSFNLSQSKL